MEKNKSLQGRNKSSTANKTSDKGPQGGHDKVPEEQTAVKNKYTDEELKEYARILGINPEDEPGLMWIAKEGLNAPLPEEWKPCQNDQGDVYYFNFKTGEYSQGHYFIKQ